MELLSPSTSGRIARYPLEVAGSSAGVMGLLVASAFPLAPDVSGILVMIAITIAAATLVLGVRDRRVQILLLTALIVRITLALLGHFAIELPDSTDDAIRFQQVSYELAASNWYELITNPITGAYFYSWLTAIFFQLTNPSVLSMIALNVLCGWLLVYLSFRIMSLISGPRAGILAIIGVGFLPSLVLYSAVTMREAPIVLALLFSVYLLLAGIRAQRVSFVVWSWVCAFFAVVLHTAMIAPFVIISVVSIFGLRRLMRTNQVRPKRWFRFGSAIVISAFSIAALTLIFGAGVGIEKLTTYAGSSNGLFDALGNQQAYGARSRAAYLVGVTAHTPLDALLQLPIRVVYFLFLPFPGMVKSPGDIFAAMDAIVYLALTLLVLVQCFRQKISSEVKVMLIVAVVMILVLAATTSNYGTAIRHRAKALPLLVMVVAARTLDVRQAQFTRMGAEISRFKKDGQS